MLKITYLDSPIDRSQALSEHLQNFSPQSPTWIVSDLRSKFEIQKKILTLQGFYEDEDVLRVNELWRLLLKRAAPEFRVLSADLIRVVVKDQLEQMKVTLSKGAEQIICDFMDQFASVFFHPMGDQSIQTWFEAHPESRERWKNWYLLAEKFSFFFLERKILSPKWISAYLSEVLADRPQLQKIWNRDLVFDLGVDITQSESDLIRIFEKNLNLKVLSPEFELPPQMQSLLKPYEFLGNRDLKKNPRKNIVRRQGESFRFSSFLGEVKHVVAQARKWADSGVPLSDIAVLAPEIEIYWPALSDFLAHEGLAVQKARTQRLSSLPVISSWLSELRLRTGQVDAPTLETAHYSGATSKARLLRVDDFQSLFENILDLQDLARSKEIEKYFGTQIQSHKKISSEEFLGQALPYWPAHSNFENLEKILKEFLSKSNFPFEMSFSNWSLYLEKTISRIETAETDLNLNSGIAVVNFSEGDSLEASHRIFLGLTQDQMRSRSIPWVLPAEILSFNRDFGFYLMDPEISQLQFDLVWLSRAPNQIGKPNTDHWCLASTDFSGNLLNPSQFWMEQCHLQDPPRHFEEISRPEPTRWDEIQHECLTQEVAFQAIQRHRDIHLSASSLERFRDCPFVFFSEKILQLRDLPEIDLDLDRRTKGQLIHAVLEKLMDPEKKLRWSLAEIDQLFEDEKQAWPEARIQDSLWKALKEKQIKVVLRFLDQEREWQKKYPQSRVLGREVSFDFKMEGMRWKGVIDRVDGDAARLVVLDYKTSAGSNQTFPKWLSENKIQLGLYTWILESGLIPEFGAREVVGAFYYVLKNLDRSAGFKTEAGHGLLDIERKKSAISSEQKKEFLQQLEAEVRLRTQEIQAGEFAPKPRDFELCDNCKWRNLCRAPHLT